MGRVTESNFDAAAETDPGYGQLFAVLMRRRFLLGVLCSVLSVATICFDCKAYLSKLYAVTHRA